MPAVKVKGPDGATYTVTAPDGATDEQILSFAASQWDQLGKEKQRSDAAAYANEYGGPKFAPTGNVKDADYLTQALGGAKHAWDRAAYGLKGLFTDLTPEEKQQLQQGAAFVKDASKAANIGEIAGDVATTGGLAGLGRAAVTKGATYLPRAAEAISKWGGRAVIPAAGAAGGALVNPEDRGGGATFGAVGSVLGEGTGRVLGKALGGVASSKVTPEARALMDEGVSVPAWKAVDEGPLRNYAERVKGLPVVGPLMKAQEGAAIRDYNKVLVQKATPPTPVLDEVGNVVSWKAAKGTPVREVGQEGVNELGKRFNAAYDAVYKGRTIPLDEQLAAQLDSVAQAADSYTPGAAPDIHGLLRKVNDTLRAGTETTKNVSQIVDASGKPIVSATPGHAGVTNDQFKRAIGEADAAVSSAWRAGDQQKAEAYGVIRDALEEARLRGLPPEVQSSLAPVNEAYRNFKLLQRASAGVGAMRNEGIVTPSQVVGAVRALDKSPSKSASARGTAFGQKEAQRAHGVLGSELPEVGPGTAEKLSVMSGMAGLGWMEPSAAAAMLTLSRPGQRMLMGGYPWQQSVRNTEDYVAETLRRVAQAKAQDRD